MLYTFGFLTPTTAVIVLIIALIIFGPGKLPEIGRSLGKSLKEFRSATRDQSQDTEDNLERTTKKSDDKDVN